MKLTPFMQDFILHWGEMGTKWGTNRTVSQIFALLYLSEKPLNAEEISDTLSVARSNVSTSIRELQSWRVIRIVNVLGDRKEYYTTLDDMWEMFRIILEERKKREIDPTLSVLRQCLIKAVDGGHGETYATKNLKELTEFFELVTSLYDQMNRFSPQQIKQLLKMGDKVVNLVSKAQ